MTIAEAKRITRMNKWRQLIHEQQQSGQSIRTWCLQNGIRENSYCNRSINLRPDNPHELCDTYP